MSTAKRKLDANYDPYKVLEIDQSSSEKDIDKAFKKQALKWHPDKNPNNLEEAQKRFIDIYKAYEFLKDKSQKTEFDEKVTAKKQRAAYESNRKATSSAKRQHFLDKLEKKEKAFETGQSLSTKLDATDEQLLRRLRKEGAQLLKRMAEERAVSEIKARQDEFERRHKEAEVAKVNNSHPHSHLYNMSLDELNAFEDEVLGS